MTGLDAPLLVAALAALGMAVVLLVLLVWDGRRGRKPKDVVTGWDVQNTLRQRVRDLRR